VHPRAVRGSGEYSHKLRTRHIEQCVCVDSVALVLLLERATEEVVMLLQQENMKVKYFSLFQPWERTESTSPSQPDA
jgi:hypothetical protein